MRTTLCVDVHSLADLADGYLAQIAATAFAARLSARELDRDGQVEVITAILAAVESLTVMARKAIEEQCDTHVAIAQQMAQEGAK